MTPGGPPGPGGPGGGGGEAPVYGRPDKFLEEFLWLCGM